MSQSPTENPVRRRAVLGVLATGVVGGTGGCLSRLRSATGWKGANRVTLQIKTLPADADPYALRIARTLAEWYGDVGIDAQVAPMAKEELLRRVLLNNEFDVFVTRGNNPFLEPDTLYALLHSRFAEAPGWGNPFGFTDLEVDEMLETQRRTTGDERREALERLQRTVVRSQPFTVVGFPDDVRTARTTNYEGWRDGDLRTPAGYLVLSRASGSGSGRGEDASGPDADDTLRVAVTDPRSTKNLNPLSAEFRRTGVVVGLLYDPLATATGADGPTPWLADSWEFPSTDGAPRATVHLRRDLRWHDGERLTADDVAFTYSFLADTSLRSDRSDGDADREPRMPAPRFQGRTELVDDVRAREARTVEFRFVDCAPGVATRAFTVPILPEHVWSERTGPAEVSGLKFGSTTEALVTDNVPPVGSGPLRFVGNTPREELVLERFDEHFLAREPGAGLPSGVAGPPVFDRFVVRVVGSDEAAIQMVARGELDVTATTVAASTVPRIGRAADIDLLATHSAFPYLIGYNVRRPPLTNSRFRSLLARLVDRASLSEGVFRGYAEPAVSPLARTEWVPEDLRWDGDDPVNPFLGTDGELDDDRVRTAFREAGFHYDGDDLVTRG